MTSIVFSRRIGDVGHFQLHPLRTPDHMMLIHDWVNRDYARYWGMQGTSLEQVIATYEVMNQSGHACAYLGLHENSPAFLLECYAPGADEVGQHYQVASGDRGMHFLVAPPIKRIPNFTLGVMCLIMEFLFSESQCERVVVEPDSRNHKVHVLNERVGFVVERQIQLTKKSALLSFCRRDQFINVLGFLHNRSEQAVS